MPGCCQIKGDAIHLAVKAIPGASKTEFAGVQNGLLRVKIAAPPEDGKANAELIAFLSQVLGCPRRDISLLRGEKSRQKIVAFPHKYVLYLNKHLLEDII